MRPTSAQLLPVLVALALLLPACAARQDSAAADPLDPKNSARQEYVADMQLKAGRAQLAVQGYDKALLARPGDAVLLVKKGQGLLRLNQPEAALEAFRLAQAASPDSPGAHYGAGQACERLGKSAEARQNFERTVALAPASWRARSHLGVLLMNSGHPGQAREQFLAALALPQVKDQAQAQAQGQAQSPARTGTARELLLNNLAVAQVLSGEPEAAVATFRQALRDARDPERSANNLGLLLVRLGRQAEALAAFRTAGNDARALNNLGYALYLKGDSAQARTLFEKALDLSPAYYETAGENLKQAVLGAAQGPVLSGAASPGVHPAGATPAEALARDAGQGAPVLDPAGPGTARISLSGQLGPARRFGPATLLEAGPARQWAY